MKRLFGTVALVLAGAVGLAAFAINYTASKSNTGNVIVSPDTITAQASAALADLEKAKGTPTQIAVSHALKNHGVDSVKMGKVVIYEITSGGGSKGYGILLLANPNDEAAAKAVAGKAASK
jgi:hypothetical protein